MKKKNLVQFVVSPDRSNKVAEFKKGVQMRRSFYLLNILWNGRNKHKKNTKMMTYKLSWPLLYMKNTLNVCLQSKAQLCSLFRFECIFYTFRWYFWVLSSKHYCFYVHIIVHSESDGNKARNYLAKRWKIRVSRLPTEKFFFLPSATFDIHTTKQWIT